MIHIQNRPGNPPNDTLYLGECSMYLVLHKSWHLLLWRYILFGLFSIKIMKIWIPSECESPNALSKCLSRASPLKWIVLAAVSDYLLLVCWHSRRGTTDRYPANAEPGIEQQAIPLYIVHRAGDTTLATTGQSSSANCETGFHLRCTFVLTSRSTTNQQKATKTASFAFQIIVCDSSYNCKVYRRRS